MIILYIDYIKVGFNMSKSKIFIVIIVVVLIALLGFGAFLGWKHFLKNDEDVSPDDNIPADYVNDVHSFNVAYVENNTKTIFFKDGKYNEKLVHSGFLQIADISLDGSVCLAVELKNDGYDLFMITASNIKKIASKVSTARLSNNGKMVLYKETTVDGLYKYDVDTGKIKDVRATGGINGIAISPNGKDIIWDFNTASVVRTDNNGDYDFIVSNGIALAVSNDYKDVYYWSTNPECYGFYVKHKDVASPVKLSESSEFNITSMVFNKDNSEIIFSTSSIKQEAPVVESYFYSKDIGLVSLSSQLNSELDDDLSISSVPLGNIYGNINVTKNVLIQITTTLPIISLKLPYESLLNAPCYFTDVNNGVQNNSVKFGFLDKNAKLTILPDDVETIYGANKNGIYLKYLNKNDLYELKTEAPFTTKKIASSTSSIKKACVVDDKLLYLTKSNTLYYKGNDSTLTVTENVYDCYISPNGIGYIYLQKESDSENSGTLCYVKNDKKILTVATGVVSAIFSDDGKQLLYQTEEHLTIMNYENGSFIELKQYKI